MRLLGVVGVVLLLGACAPAAVRQGNRAVRAGHWADAHDAYARAAARWPGRSRYVELAESTRVQAAEELLEDALLALDAGRYDEAVGFVDDALARAEPIEVSERLDTVIEALAEVPGRLIAAGDIDGAYRLLGAVDRRFPGVVDAPRTRERIRKAAAAEADRLLEAGQADRAVALWDVLDRHEPDRRTQTNAARLDSAVRGAAAWISADRLEDAVRLFERVPGSEAARDDARRSAAARGLDNATASLRAARRDEGLRWFDRARALTPEPAGFGTKGAVPGLLADAGRAELSEEGPAAGFRWVEGLERRLPGSAVIEPLRRDVRAAVEPTARGLVDADRFEEALALLDAVAALDPDWRDRYAKQSDAARGRALDRLVERARAARGLDAALAELDRAVALNTGGRALVPSTDALPRDLAREADDRLHRDGVEAGYPAAARLVRAFPEDGAVGRLLTSCRDTVRADARQAFFEGRFDRADALFGLARSVDAGARVADWEREARAGATLDALGRVGVAVAAGDPSAGLGWVDLATRIGGDATDVRVAREAALTALLEGARWVARTRNVEEGYALLSEIERRFQGRTRPDAVRGAAYARADDFAAARRYEDALATLDVVRRHEPDRGWEVDRRRQDVVDRWAADLEREAVAAERRGEEAVAFVRWAQAARIGGRTDGREGARQDLLADRGAVIGLTLTGSWRGTASERALLGALEGRPGLLWTAGDWDAELKGRVERAAGCETRLVGEEPAVHRYLGAAQSVPNPERAAREEALRGAGEALVGAERALGVAEGERAAAERVYEAALVDADPAALSDAEVLLGAARAAEAAARAARDAARTTADAARRDRDVTPVTVLVRPELEHPYVVRHEARVCWTELRFSGMVLPSRATAPTTWREDARADGVRVQGDSAVGLASITPDFGSDDDRLADTDARVAAGLGALLLREAGALRDQRVARASRATSLDEATGDWLVAWWIDPERVPGGLDAFLRASWPGVEREDLAPR